MYSCLHILVPRALDIGFRIGSVAAFMRGTLARGWGFRGRKVLLCPGNGIIDPLSGPFSFRGAGHVPFSFGRFWFFCFSCCCCTCNSSQKTLTLSSVVDEAQNPAIVWKSSCKKGAVLELSKPHICASKKPGSFKLTLLLPIFDYFHRHKANIKNKNHCNNPLLNFNTNIVLKVRNYLSILLHILIYVYFRYISDEYDHLRQ